MTLNSVLLILSRQMSLSHRNPPTANHLTTDPPNTYPKTPRPAAINLRQKKRLDVKMLLILQI